MKKRTLKHCLFGFLSFISFTVLAQGPEIGTVPVYNMNSTTVLFVDATNGEMKSFAILEEPVWSVAVNEEEGVFYALTKHTMYKANVESGEVMDSYEFQPVLEQQPGETVDPNLQIIPYGITKDGYGFYSYNEEYINLQREQQKLLASMQGASLEEVTAISKKIQEMTPRMTKLALQQPLQKIDFNAKSKSLFGTFDVQSKRILKVDQNGIIKVHDKVKEVFEFIDAETNQVVKELSATGLFQVAPEFRSIQNLNVMMVSDDLIQYSAYGLNGLMGGKYILFNIKTNEVIFEKDFESPMGAIYPLFYENCDSYIFADKSCDIGPMPAIPDFGQPDGYSKKKIAAWQEEMKKKQLEHQKALNEWQDRATNPDNCEIKILEGKDINNVKMVIPKASFASVFNNKYCMVNRIYELAMYDLETNELVWTIDTEF